MAKYSEHEEQKRLKKLEILKNREFYKLNSILGYSWAMWYFLLGGREAGKSYAVTNCYVNQYVKYKRPFYWLRLSDSSAKALLQNDAQKLIDPDLARKYNLDLVTNGNRVYHVTKRGEPTPKNPKGKILEKELMCTVMSLATFYNDKGSGYFDNEFLNNPMMYYNICLDEMNREKNEKKSFDIVYAFVNQLENLIRSTKKKVRIICIGNTLEEASDILCAFNFIPESFGRFKLVKNKKLLEQYLRELEQCKGALEESKVNQKYKNVDFGKRAVIEYIEPSEAYLTRRKGTIADILMPDASTFTNKIDTDKTLLYSGRLISPKYIIKFAKTPNSWFTVWDNNVVAQYHGEKCNQKIAMKPYLDEIFNMEVMNNVISQFDYRAFQYKNLITFKEFQKAINLMKPRGN